MVPVMPFGRYAQHSQCAGFLLNHIVLNCSRSNKFLVFAIDIGQQDHVFDVITICQHYPFPYSIQLAAILGVALEDSSMKFFNQLPYSFAHSWSEDYY